jgi:hypothetical protein
MSRNQHPSKLLSQRPISGLTVLAVAILGVYFLSSSHAATPYASSEAADGNLFGTSSIEIDSNASDGKYVQFGTVMATTRSNYEWPFAWNSIWNMPISSDAVYAPANIVVDGTYEGAGSSDYDSVDPSFPVKTLTGGSEGNESVHVDPSMMANGDWNTCSAWLGTDNMTIYQGQTTELSEGGNPTFAGQATLSWPSESIEGTGSQGCHGGSSLSGLGGTLTNADLSGSTPIQHALKMLFDCNTGCYNQPETYYGNTLATAGYRWPATTADGQFNVPGTINYYGGSDPDVVEGSLLALPPSTSLSSFTNTTILKLATALQTYGAYIVDNTADGNQDLESFVTNYNANSYFPLSNSSFSSQLDQLISDLEVVNNNSASTPGGGSIGSPRYAQYAPAFTDGAGGSTSPVTVVSP